jgi:hypothetical protein
MGDKLEAGCRCTAKRLAGPEHPDLDVVDLRFDWLVSASIAEPLTFLLNITRGTRTSSVRFQIDLTKLATVDLQRLHNLLATRPRGY